MSRTKTERTVHDRWAELKFSIVGRLLCTPPPKGELATELRRLSETLWTHPVSGEPVRFAFSTIERWYYRARRAGVDRVGQLRRRPRCDGGRCRALSDAQRQLLIAQYRAHPGWSYLLHAENLRACLEADPSLGRAPSYATVRRFLRSEGLLKRRRPRCSRDTEGARRAEARFEAREVRSFEVAEVNALWHLDYHYARRTVLTERGECRTPVLLAVLDDRSRLACHLQWYLEETAENLVHALSQAFLKRGLPAGLLSDNGGPMVADETSSGLLRLGIVHETTLPYSPYQNGKQESFFGTVEGRLMAMLENQRDLTLSALNTATIAWMEMEYNRRRHDEIGESPYERFLRGPDLGRPAPAARALRLAFTLDQPRSQRRSDGTVSIAGRRFEVPSRFAHLTRLHVRYARWDLRCVHLVDPRTGVVLDRLYPQDKLANADRRRRTRRAPRTFTNVGADEQAPPPTTAHATPEDPGGSAEIAPLLRALIAEYAATGLPPAYLPKSERAQSHPLEQEDPS